MWGCGKAMYLTFVAAASNDDMVAKLTAIFHVADVSAFGVLAARNSFFYFYAPMPLPTFSWLPHTHFLSLTHMRPRPPAHTPA